MPTRSILKASRVGKIANQSPLRALFQQMAILPTLQSNVVERADQNVNRSLGKARTHRALISRDIAACCVRRFCRLAERPRLGEGVERFLLQLLSLELDRLDPVAQRF